MATTTESTPKINLNRRARMSSGITGMTVEFQLVHLQNMSIRRDAAAKWLKNEPKVDETSELILSLHNIINSIVRQDFPSPVNDIIWEYDQEELLPSKY